jgi:hypothetical protein
MTIAIITEIDTLALHSWCCTVAGARLCQLSELLGGLLASRWSAAAAAAATELYTARIKA